MRAVVQRVNSAKVEVGEVTVGQIERGLLVLVAVHHTDGEKQAQWLANKIVGLRLFCDENGKMNLSLDEIKGQILVVSQFTLYGDCRHGRRPSYSESAEAEKARQLYKYFVECVRQLGLEVQEGEFQAHMHVTLENDGPVTVIVDTP